MTVEYSLDRNSNPDNLQMFRVEKCDSEGQMLGYAIGQITIESLSATLETLFVHIDSRGKGIGRALLEGLKIEAKSRGAEYMTGEVLPRPGDISRDEVLIFYQACGFQIDQAGNLFCDLE